MSRSTETPRDHARALRCVVALLASLLPAACAVLPSQPSASGISRGSHYVAMGSSFGAGPGVTTVAPGTPARCARSVDNYAQQLARQRGLALVDVTCSAATTAHVLGHWDELPPQLDALRTHTRLVTVTIGGNDLGYIGGLLSASCKALSLEASLAGRPCGRAQLPDPAAYEQVASALRAIAAQVRARAPVARLVFVDYATVLPAAAPCERTPLTVADAVVAREIAAQLEQITAVVAQAVGADLLAASSVTREHHACAAEPWINGFTRPGPNATRAAYHPNLAGMTAVAAALDQLLQR